MTYTPASTRYDTMPYRRAGRSGLRLPPISLGLWQNFGQNRPLEVQRAIIRRAFDLGVTHVDLANNYGVPYGSAETNFGAILRDHLRSHRDELIISTKAGFDMWPGPYGDLGSRKSLLASLDQSLDRLGIPYVDVFYSHRPDPDTPIAETMGALATAVTSGRALYVGLSNYSAAETREAVDALDRHGITPVLHQPRYSMFDREVEAELLPELDRLGIGCVVYSPLAQGMLTDRYLDGTIPPGSRARDGHDLPAEDLDATFLRRARALNTIARERGQTLAQLALTWVLRHGAVTSAIIGASSVEQLEDNVAAARATPLDSVELERIEEHAVHGTARS